MTRICRHCREEFEVRPGKPGLIDECNLSGCRQAEEVDLLGGNMVYSHKTAATIEIKLMGDAKRMKRLTDRWGAGVTKSLTR